MKPCSGIARRNHPGYVVQGSEYEESICRMPGRGESFLATLATSPIRAAMHVYITVDARCNGRSFSCCSCQTSGKK